MAEAHETVTFDYDSYNDVMRIFAPGEDSDRGGAIAVPSGGSTVVLISEGLDRVVGIVFESFLPQLRATAPEPLSDLGDKELVDGFTRMIEGFIPGLLEGARLQAKDQVQRWRSIVG